jgi:hypothetical protein
MWTGNFETCEVSPRSPKVEILARDYLKASVELSAVNFESQGNCECDARTQSGRAFDEYLGSSFSSQRASADSGS